MSLASSSVPYFCTKCYESLFPFQTVDNIDFNENFNHNHKTTKPNLNLAAAYVGDGPDGVNSEYITTSNFKEKYSQSNSLFLFHTNTRSLAKNLDQLEQLLTNIEK